MAKSSRFDLKTLLLTSVSAALGAAIAWYFISHSAQSGAKTVASAPTTVVPDCSYRLDRIGSYRYTHPLYQAEPDCESPNLLPLKAEITEHIDQAVKAGPITNASVYLRSFSRGQWMVVHNELSFELADLSRLPVMISWMNAYQDGVRANHVLPPPSTTIRNLDSLLLSASNTADTATIGGMARQLLPEQWEEMFHEIGLKAPPTWNSGKATAHDYGAFMKVVFNSTLLGPEDSDRILGALERNRNTSVMGAFFPPSLAVCGVHAEQAVNGRSLVHEAGIVMEDNGPYLVVVMTEAKDATAARDLVRWILDRINTRMRGGTSSTGLGAGLVG